MLIFENKSNQIKVRKLQQSLTNVHNDKWCSSADIDDITSSLLNYRTSDSLLREIPVVNEDCLWG